MNRRKDGRYQKSITVTMPDGSKKRKSFYGATVAEINKKLLAYNDRCENGIMMSELCDRWLDIHSESVSYKTQEGYVSPLKKIKSQFGNRYAKDVTPAEVQAFINSLAKQGYKRSSVQRPLDMLRMIYDYAITSPDIAITVNPCTSVKLPSGLAQARRSLADPSDIQKIKDSVNINFGLFPYLLLYTGMRKGEALALTDKDFDFDDNTISITKSVTWQPNRPVIKEPKTESSIRTIPLLAPLRSVLPKWKGYLFSPDGGKSPLSQIETRHRWARYVKETGISLVPHQLRHEFATLCLDAELSSVDAQKILGHSRPSTTEAVYQHIRDSRQKVSAQKLEDYLKSKYAVK